jgi:hypothetical protein
LEVAQQTDREARLQRDHTRLNNLVEELTLELKKATRPPARSKPRPTAL